MQKDRDKLSPEPCSLFLSQMSPEDLFKDILQQTTCAQLES